MPEVSLDIKGATQFSNFEDISLARDCDEDDSFRYSNMSTPTLTSDSSSLRSSLSSWSSPTLPAGPFSARPQEGSHKLSLPDNTSMASLSRIPVSQRRSHKQRECDYARDTDDFWPTDALMFNVPMSPALCAQEKRPSTRKSRNLPPIKEKDHEVLDSETRDIQLKYASSTRVNVLKEAKPSSNHSKQNSSGSSGSSSNGSNSSSKSPKASRRSLTRPDHLPPKSQDEERRHMMEYSKLVAHAKAQEKVREEEVRASERRRSEQRESDAELWHKALQMGSKIDRALWWRGVPEKYRGAAWTKALRASSVDISENTCMHSALAANCAHVLPETGLFQAGRPLHESLVSVVATVAELREISIASANRILYPAAVLLLALDEQVAASCLAQLIPSGGLVHAVLTENEGVSEAHYTSYYKVFRAKFPQLYAHFTSIRLAPHQYLDTLVSSLMTNLVTVDSACRLMDLLVSEGESFVLRAALGIVRVHEPLLYQSREQVILTLQTHLQTGEDELIETIKSISR